MAMTPAVRLYVAMHGDDEPRVIPLPANLFSSCSSCGSRLAAYVKTESGKLVTFGQAKLICAKCAKAMTRQDEQEAAMWAAK